MIETGNIFTKTKTIHIQLNMKTENSIDDIKQVIEKLAIEKSALLNLNK